MLQDWLRARADASPDALALLYEGEQWSYADLDALTDRLAIQLRRYGVEPGDHVGILLPNCPSYVGLIHALARLHAVLVPLNTRLTETELTWQIEFTGLNTLVYGAETAAQAEAIGDWRLADGEGQRLHLNTLLPEDANSSSNTRKAGPNADALRPEFPMDNDESFPVFDLNAVQAIVFTSGTTGQPKGVVLTFANHFWGANASAYRLGLQTDDRWLSCLPLYHVGGLAVVFRSCLYGTAVVLHARFDVEAFLLSLENEAVTLTSVVPTMLHRLLNAVDAKAPRPRMDACSPLGMNEQKHRLPDSLRLVLLGGAAAAPDLLERCRNRQLPVSTTYGLTEAASQVATQRPEETMQKPGSVGRPLMFTQVRVVDPSGKLLPSGELGEITVRGPTVMAGYYRNPEATAHTLRDGWLHTGDIGYLDDDGDLWLVQRRSDVIISGGENVYPAEVEAALRRHPAVVEACVVGVPDMEWGQLVAAMVQRSPDSNLTEQELSVFLRQHLAGYKQPRRIDFVTDIPRTASGKLERRTVAEHLAAT